ncbi:MAG: hypothetical protein M0Z75_08940 [Nitrospiraceae bacterium]|nr:hypothetical protein [Nitrospiraceae bacterium]
MSNKKLVTSANILLSVLLVLTCIFLARDFITLSISGSRGIKNSLVPTREAVESKTRAVLSDYSAVAGKDNLFGFPPMDIKQLTASSAQAVTSNISLIGTVSGAWSYAVVLRDAREEVYRAGQMIPGVGYLKSINKDSALIASQAGGDLKLPLKDIATIEAANGNAAASQGPASSQNQIVMSGAQDSYVLNKRAVADALQNPTRILSDARMLPNIVNGRQQGFVIREVKPEGLFSALGLRNGDVLLKINNNEISGPDMALRAFTALKGLDRVDLDIIRGGQKLTLVYQIR